MEGGIFGRGERKGERKRGKKIFLDEENRGKRRGGAEKDVEFEVQREVRSRKIESRNVERSGERLRE